TPEEGYRQAQRPPATQPQYSPEGPQSKTSHTRGGNPHATAHQALSGGDETWSGRVNAREDVLHELPASLNRNPALIVTQYRHSLTVLLSTKERLQGGRQAHSVAVLKLCQVVQRLKVIQSILADRPLPPLALRNNRGPLRLPLHPRRGLLGLWPLRALLGGELLSGNLLLGHL